MLRASLMLKGSPAGNLSSFCIRHSHSLQQLNLSGFSFWYLIYILISQSFPQSVGKRLAKGVEWEVKCIWDDVISDVDDMIWRYDTCCFMIWCHDTISWHDPCCCKKRYLSHQRYVHYVGRSNCCKWNKSLKKKKWIKYHTVYTYRTKSIRQLCAKTSSCVALYL